MSGFYHDFYNDAQHDPGVFGHDPGAYNIHHGAHYGMDGSGHMHAAHQHGQSFDSKGYAQAFGGHTHHHPGILAQLLGLDQGNRHHGWLASLLGLDSKHQYVHQTPVEVTRQGQFLWENLGRVFKHDLFNEFELTSGKLFFLLLAGMVGWLFVLSFTRHNESQVNAMLGSNVAQVAAYENSARLQQPSQTPVELPTNNIQSFYTSQNRYNLSRLIAKQDQGFVVQEAPPASVPTVRGPAILDVSNGSSFVKTVDGRVQTIVNR
jgi:hypothetical protein